MEHRQWMYKGRPSQGKMTEEWKEKTKQFIDRAFEWDKTPNGTSCPCSKCRNQKRVSKGTMTQHLVVHGFTPFYHTWEFHGEKPSKRARDKEAEQSTQILGTGEFDAGIDDCIGEANASENPAVEETHEKLDQSTKKYYDTLFAAQKPLHSHTEVTQLDAITRLMALKCDLNLSRDAFDDLLTIIASILPQGQILPKNMYETNKILKTLKLPSMGSKNVPVSSSSNLHESPVIPTTASQPPP